ncbi:phosphoenolpyruvate-dependent sugar PTS family porter, EIIA 1 [Peptoanaerobacter stomatis]|uniref:Phosphoenolpyruvate-dependent sugar PTS family porter, EIIA 1 n=1 Tax=Peptoanaerobacter stomatis TaxID=796937 RepID=J6H9C7_9FIRM|nr:PTS glucose transporter subunit IIA [Peptoanaerobacter stomatis]EJU19513.1 phosphoenolpyruvate-dependent sugar PTS family porter, EIIA 1 [Peptoanaerobacter stomatis]NWO25304.1 PTS glucose transporter subunit IIA [Peptostreptococcaceae bacterium oral taxon 081]
MGLFGFGKKKEKVELKAVVDGIIKDLKNVEDEVFSKGFLGEGLAIVPKSNNFYAPVSGELSSVFPTGHAFGINTDDGAEVLIHIGIDTVQMEGDGFDLKVEQGQKVKAGDLLVVCDVDNIKNKGYKTDTILIITNSDDFPSEQLVTEGTEVKANEISVIAFK